MRMLPLTNRRISLLLVLLSLFAGTSGRTQPAVVTHFNQFQPCAYRQQLDSAFYHAHALAGLNEAMLNGLMHDVFAQQLQTAASRADTAFAFRLLRKLYTDSTSMPLKRATYPLYWYVAAAKSLGDTAKTRKIVASFMKAQQRIGEGLDNRFDRYALLMYQQLQQQPIYAALADTLFRQTWNRLEHAVNDLYFQAADDWKRKTERAYYRYLMAAAHTMKAEEAGQQQDLAALEQYRKGASDYSPDEFDRQVKSGYFYEAVFLFHDAERTDFRQPYVDLLLARGDTVQAIRSLTDMAIADPGHLPLLKTYYAKAPVAGQPFGTYWTQAFNAKLKPAEPFSLTSLTNQVFDYAQHKGKWVLIDFWGTWCAPCVAELPKVQALYDDMQQNNQSDFVLLTVSCHEIGGVATVQAFLKKTGYTFPVVIGDVPLIRQFRVDSYPTKVLITPQGNRLKIPSGTDLAKRVKQYMNN